ncbi:hypothetical protein CWI38_1971p0010 [Hamiltosporidium tvaerminnensis]|uniref:Uncharacterized protein n=1 Tax=Hamiltosporidium tvaerminnensis TaxID=1176355 RepID=A0A4Q9LPP4_9MICR|nr:hypothetical protein CWI38_1971p0010 [Hamiltosporidium tvaerminnensis]
MPKIVSFKNRQEKEILTAYLKTGQNSAGYSKEAKRLLRHKAEHFTSFGDDIGFKRRDQIIRAVQSQLECVNQTIKRWLAKKLHETGGIRWVEHLNNFVYAYNRTIYGTTNKSPFMLFFRQPVENDARIIVHFINIYSDMILEIASDIHEEFTETVTTTTTIIADDLEIDNKIRSDVAKHFKNYREIIIESSNSNRQKRDLSIGDQVLIKKRL